MNYEKVLDNGVVVQDFSTPFGGMANAQPQTASQPSGAFGQLNTGLYDNLAVNMPNVPTGQTVSRPDLGAVAGALDNINAVTPQQAMQQALAPGQFGDGRVGLGGGFSAGKVPGGFGIQFDTMFAKGGVVENQGIASLMKRR